MTTLQREWLLHTGTVLLVGPVFLVLVVATLLAARGDASLRWVPWVVIALGVLVMASNLSVRRDPERIVLVYFPFGWHRIPLGSVTSASVVRFRPLRDYGGWGVRWGNGGLAFTVGGKQGVKLELAGGRHVVIGSREPESLLRALDLPTPPDGAASRPRSDFNAAN